MYNDGVFMMEPSFNRDAVTYCSNVNADRDKILKAGANLDGTFDLNNISQPGTYTIKGDSFTIDGERGTLTCNKYVDLNGLEVFKEEIRKKIETGEWRERKCDTDMHESICKLGLGLKRKDLLTLNDLWKNA